VWVSLGTYSPRIAEGNSEVKKRLLVKRNNRLEDNIKMDLEKYSLKT